MQEKPYYCPNCRSNRTKFRMLTTYAQQFIKDPISGEIHDLQEPVEIAEQEPTITCMVCDFSGNELRFVKQAEREPRVITSVTPTYH